AQVDVATLQAAARGLAALTAAYQTLTRRQQTYDAAVEAVTRARAVAETAAKTLMESEARTEGTNAETVALLAAASKLLASHKEEDACPLCLATEQAAHLKARIGERLDAMSAIQTAVARDGEAQRSLLLAEQDLAKEQLRYTAECSAFEA